MLTKEERLEARRALLEMIKVDASHEAATMNPVRTIEVRGRVERLAVELFAPLLDSLDGMERERDEERRRCDVANRAGLMLTDQINQANQAVRDLVSDQARLILDVTRQTAEENDRLRKRIVEMEREQSPSWVPTVAAILEGAAQSGEHAIDVARRLATAKPPRLTTPSNLADDHLRTLVTPQWRVETMRWARQAGFEGASAEDLLAALLALDEAEHERDESNRVAQSNADSLDAVARMANEGQSRAETLTRQRDQSRRRAGRLKKNRDAWRERAQAARGEAGYLRGRLDDAERIAEEDADALALIVRPLIEARAKADDERNAMVKERDEAERQREAAHASINLPARDLIEVFDGFDVSTRALSPVERLRRLLAGIESERDELHRLLRELHIRHLNTDGTKRTGTEIWQEIAESAGGGWKALAEGARQERDEWKERAEQAARAMSLEHYKHGAPGDEPGTCEACDAQAALIGEGECCSDCRVRSKSGQQPVACEAHRATGARL